MEVICCIFTVWEFQFQCGLGFFNYLPSGAIVYLIGLYLTGSVGQVRGCCKITFLEKVVVYVVCSFL